MLKRVAVGPLLFIVLEALVSYPPIQRADFEIEPDAQALKAWIPESTINENSDRLLDEQAINRKIKNLVFQLINLPQAGLQLQKVHLPHPMLPDGAVTFSDGPEVFLVSNTANRDLYVFSISASPIGRIYPAGPPDVWTIERPPNVPYPGRVKYRVDAAGTHTIYSEFSSDLAEEPVPIERTLDRWRFYEIKGTRLIKSAGVTMSFAGDLAKEDRRPGKYFVVEELLLERRANVEAVVEERGEYLNISSHLADDGYFDSCRVRMILRVRDHQVLPGSDLEGASQEDRTCIATAPPRLWHIRRR